MNEKRETSIGKFRISGTGVKVFINYRDNIIIDKDSKVLTTKASYPREKYSKGNVKNLSRFGSENSEDAKTWNLFRTLELHNQFNKYYEAIGIADKAKRVLFWGMDSNTAEFDNTLQATLDEIEPPNLWTIQQTEPDVIIIGEKTIIFNESKLGKPGTRIDAWNRKDPFEKKHDLYKEKAKSYFNNSFVENFSVEGRRYYQLVRNLIVGEAYAKHLGKEFHLVALMSNKNTARSGLSHKEELERFLSFANDPSRCHLLTWDQI